MKIDLLRQWDEKTLHIVLTETGLIEFPDHTYMMEDDVIHLIPAYYPKINKSIRPILSLGSKSVSPCQAF